MGRVIRAQRTGPAVVSADVFAAKHDARVIRAQAEEDARVIRERAHDAGFAAGNAAAAKQLFDIDQLKNELIARTERDATRAVLLVAAELLGATLEAQPEQILRVLTPHLARMRRAQQLVLHVHPSDAAWLEAHPDALAALCKQTQLDGAMHVQSDASIARGGVLIESNLGGLDARIETRLTMLADALGMKDLTFSPQETP